MESKTAMTAMQQMIDFIQSNMNGVGLSLSEEGLTKEEKIYYTAAIKVAKANLSKAIELRDTVEKEQIVDAFTDGQIDLVKVLWEHGIIPRWNDINENDREDGINYYNQKYKQ